jgi:hypothetical protein
MRQLGRRQRIREVAQPEDRQALSPADRSRMGIYSEQARRRRVSGATMEMCPADSRTGPMSRLRPRCLARAAGRSPNAATDTLTPRLSEVIAPMRSVSTICWATWESGRRTAGTGTTAARPRMGVRGLPAIVPCARCAAVRGTTPLWACALRTASGAPLLSGCTAADSVLPGAIESGVVASLLLIPALAQTAVSRTRFGIQGNNSQWLDAASRRCDLLLPRYRHNL